MWSISTMVIQKGENMVLIMKVRDDPVSCCWTRAHQQLLGTNITNDRLPTTQHTPTTHSAGPPDRSCVLCRGSCKVQYVCVSVSHVGHCVFDRDIHFNHHLSVHATAATAERESGVTLDYRVKCRNHCYIKQGYNKSLLKKKNIEHAFLHTAFHKSMF